jgi:WD40 repeat protein
MKKYFVYICLLFLAPVGTKAQESLVLTSYQYENYPEITAEFFLLDSELAPLDFTSQDFSATDNGRQLSISSLTEGNKQQNVTPHHIILLDAGLSNLGGESSILNVGKQLARNYISELDGEQEHVSIISFSDIADIIMDKTLDYDSALEALDQIAFDANSSLNAAFKFPSSGLVDYIGRYADDSFNVVLITGNYNEFDETVLANLPNTIINTSFMIRNVNPGLESLSAQSGGYFFDNIKSMEHIGNPVAASIAASRSYTPYVATLKDILNCDTNHEFNLTIFDTLSVQRDFFIEDALRPLIAADPGFLSFSSVLPGETKTLNVALRAQNSEIFIDSIRIENDYDGIFEIVSGKVNQTIAIGKDQAHNVTVAFNPVDSAIVFTKLIVYSNACDGNEVLMTGGFPNTPPNEETITVLAPECGQTLVAGDTFKIEWTGVLPKDVIQLEYSVDSGQVWDTLATNVVDLEYEWLVPFTLSDNCLVRAIQLWPNNIGRTLDLPHNNILNKGIFSKDGSTVLTASADNIVRLWNSNTGSLIREYQDSGEGHTDEITDVIFSPDEQYVISSSKDSRIIVWNTESGEIENRLLGHNQPVRDMALAADNTLISVSRSDGSDFSSKVILWDYENAILLREYSDFSKPIPQKWLLESVEAHPSKNEFVLSDLSDFDGNLNAYELDPAEESLNLVKSYDLKTLGQFSTYAKFSTISPDGKYIIVSENKSVQRPGMVFDYESETFLYDIYHSNFSQINSAQFYFDEENKWIITTGHDKLAILWNAENGDSLATFKEHTGNITYAEFNFDGSRVITNSTDQTAKVWNLKERDLQMDTTDCEFTISTAIIESEALFAGESVLRQSVDTTFSEFIYNASDFSYDVFDIRIEGANSDEFSILAGLAPYQLENKGFASINISFTPQDIGVRRAKLIVDYPGSTVEIELTGIGVDPGIRQITNIVDFEEVELGDYLTISALELIENTSAQPVDIDSIKITGIERDFFSYAELASPTQLPTTGILNANIRFTPLEVAPFAATMRIYHSAPNSPTNILLTGTGIPQTIDTLSFELGSAIADPGEIVNIPMNVTANTLNLLEGTENSIVFDLEFDITVLEPLGSFTEVSSQNQKRTVRYDVPISQQLLENGSLGNLDFRIALGMDSISKLSIKNLRYEGDSKVILSAASGEVKVASLCEEGGLRLFDGRGILQIGDIAPNPITTSSSVQIELAESAFTNIFILDATGKVVQTLRNEYMQSGLHSLEIDISTLPHGSYNLIVQTEYDFVRTQFVVTK